MPTPNLEVGTSRFLGLVLAYLDPLVVFANKILHLRHNHPPYLSDENSAQYQATSASPLLDHFSGPRHRHILFGLLYYFLQDFAIVFLALTLTSITSFAAPIGINKILKYLESDSQDATVHVWVWVLLLFFGPLAQSLSAQWHKHVETDIQVRAQALLTQLVFEHSLRIRMKRGPPNNTVEASDTSTWRLEDMKNSSGKIYNLVSTDLDRIAEGVDFLSVLFQAPLQTVLCTLLLYRILGWSAVVCLVAVLVLSPLARRIGNQVRGLSARKMKMTDARIEILTEAVTVLRMIKLFGWERKMAERIENQREEELYWLWKTKVVKVSSGLVSIFVPTITMLVTFATHTLLLKQELNASKIFPSMAIFAILWEQLGNLAWRSAVVIESKVSLDRIDDFLQKTELLDRYKPFYALDKHILVLDDYEEDSIDTLIGFRNATFVWEGPDEVYSSSSPSQTFRLHIDGELLFRKGSINLIVGPTGSGKTSILMALLGMIQSNFIVFKAPTEIPARRWIGEMHLMQSNSNPWFGLPRGNGVAYAAQESWIQNATVRENIIFGSTYDEARYHKVIHQCALQHDLVMFEDGDRTEIGERGLVLSGGQKARITLARAIYSNAAILLLDDVLASLDAHTASWIVHQCFCGDLVKGRTVLLVTHNVELTLPAAGFVVSIGLDGSITTHEATPSNSFVPTSGSASMPGEYTQEPSGSSEVEDLKVKSKVAGKVIPGEVSEGHITWRSLKLLLAGLGGAHPAMFVLIWMSGMFATEFVVTLQTWFLGLWGSQYTDHLPPQVNLLFYIGIFSVLLVIYIIGATGTVFYYNYCSINASRIIHASLVNSIFRAPLRWLDKTPPARIITRCTQDIGIIDGPIIQTFMHFVLQLIGMSTKLGVIMIFTPLFVLPGISIGFLVLFLGKIYLRAQTSAKHEASNARSPLLAHFSAALNGLVSVRAYGAQNAFKEESLKRIDDYNRADLTSEELRQWLRIRVDSLGALFTAGLALYLVYGPYIGAANTGFCLNMAVSFCNSIFLTIDLFDELEVESNSLERIESYINIEHEVSPAESRKPPAAWPASGDLVVENLSARYSKSSPEILHSISFHLPSGQRIGVVGKTGSGKSSLMLALLRCINIQGRVFYDGVATDTIDLEALRSSITIIPQTPELLGGTLRQNLDPFEQYDDLTLNNALRNSGLFSLQEAAGITRLSLDSKISSTGSNLSVGERQIIALARAMIRGSKLLILDEATSAIDYETDAIIQETLKSQLGADVTVITIAHRLQTIMDADKIMVLDSGHLVGLHSVEFDSPKELLKNENGFFRDLVNSSGEESNFLDNASLETVDTLWG